MSSSRTTIDYIVEQLSPAGNISARKMFGEYGIYHAGKLVGLVCNDQLFVKPTSAGKAYLGKAVEAPPYPGAKPSFLIPDAKWDDAEWLSALIVTTAKELPAPRDKKRRG